MIGSCHTIDIGDFSDVGAEPAADLQQPRLGATPRCAWMPVNDSHCCAWHTQNAHYLCVVFRIV